MEQKIKKIIFYKSALCPRCMMTGRILARIKETNKDLVIEEIDIMAHPLKAWQDGIRMIPALKSGEKVVSGLILNEERIRDFFEGI